MTIRKTIKRFRIKRTHSRKRGVKTPPVLFEKTHKITAIDSIDDIRKAQTYDYKELETYSLRQKRLLLAERRPAIMQWYYLQPFKRINQTS